MPWSVYRKVCDRAFVGEGAFGHPPDLAGICGSELDCPFADGLKRDPNAANGEHLLDMAKAERKTEIEPHRIADDFGRKAMAFVKMTGAVGRTFGHGTTYDVSLHAKLRRRYPFDASESLTTCAEY